MLGVSPLDLGRLRVSVGYGGKRNVRLLSPVEVAEHFRNATVKGQSLEDIAKEVPLSVTNIKRFLNLLDLPKDIKDWVDWADKNFISFSSAVELAKISDSDDKLIVAKSILKDRLSSKEVEQVAQLQKRAKKSIEECIKEIVGMRPTVERRYVFIGSVVDKHIRNALSKLTQNKRDMILAACLEKINLEGAVGRLGEQFFTLVGSDSFNDSMRAIGKENLEKQIQFQIALNPDIS